jgi:bifunctional ADP-heptose synthase (sugar kinase/adenylyltransferase)
MDTRSKILTPAAARLLPAPLAVATGYFEILRAELLGELREARERAAGAALMAVVLPLANGAQDQRARAELAAGLRMVDYVVIAEEEDPRALIDSLKPVATVRLEEAEARRARELRDQVGQASRPASPAPRQAGRPTPL